MSGFKDWANKYAPAVALATAVIFIGMMILPLTVAAGFASFNSGGGGSNQSAAGGTVAGGPGGTCKLSKTQAYKEIDSNDKEPPPALIPVYQAAAAKYNLGPKGPSILAGHNKQETNFGRSTLPGVRSGANGSGAGGPMQFLQGTWDGYGVDGNGDGRKDRYDPVDAIFGAARYLKASGAPGDWRGAMAAYYGADVDGYVDNVLRYAQQYNLPGPQPC